MSVADSTFIARVPSPHDEGEQYGRELARSGELFPAHLPGSRYAHMLAYKPQQWREFRRGMVKGYAACKPARGAEGEGSA